MVAENAHDIAVSKIKTSNQKVRDIEKNIKEKEDELFRDRTAAVLELRTNQVHVREKAATQSQRHIQKQKIQQQRLENEKDSMLAKGLNPYEEFRRNEIDESDRKKKEKLRDAVAVNKAELAERLIREEDIERKAQIIERRNKVCEVIRNICIYFVLSVIR
jgi:hypothetical protein